MRTIAFESGHADQSAARPSVSPIVVAINPADPHDSALEWAASEASRAGRPLLILAASGDFLGASPASAPGDEQLVADLDRVCEEVLRKRPALEVRTELSPGSPLDVILDAAPACPMVVIGGRPHGFMERVFVGSIAIAAAGRASIPTVVVPARWMQPAADSPVVVGLVSDNRNQSALRFGFARAVELGAPLVAVHVWDVHPAVAVTADARRRWQEGVLKGVAGQLAPFREEYPDVDARAVQRRDIPSGGLIDESIDAQLLVLGRHTPANRVGGFPLESVTRQVLHRGVCPVAVVPGR